MRRGTKESGFSLIEMLVALSLAAILAGIAYPSMYELYAAYQLRSAAYMVSFEIQRARMQAIAQSKFVMVDVQSDHLCRVTSDNGSDFSDCETADRQDLPASVTASGPDSGTPPTFTPTGLLNSGAASITVSNASGSRGIAYNVLGRTTVTTVNSNS